MKGFHCVLMLLIVISLALSFLLYTYKPSQNKSSHRNTSRKVKFNKYPTILIEGNVVNNGYNNMNLEIGNKKYRLIFVNNKTNNTIKIGPNRIIGILDKETNTKYNTIKILEHHSLN